MPKNYDKIAAVTNLLNEGYSELECLAMGYGETNVNEAIERMIMRGDERTYRCKDCGCNATRITRNRQCRACWLRTEVSA